MRSLSRYCCAHITKTGAALKSAFNWPACLQIRERISPTYLLSEWISVMRKVDTLFLRDSSTRGSGRLKSSAMYNAMESKYSSASQSVRFIHVLKCPPSEWDWRSTSISGKEFGNFELLCMLPKIENHIVQRP